MVHIRKTRRKRAPPAMPVCVMSPGDSCSASVPLYRIHSRHTFLPEKKRDYQSMGWPSPDECLKLRWVELTAIVSTWLAVSSKNIEWVPLTWPSSWNFLTSEPPWPQLTPATSSVSSVVRRVVFLALWTAKLGHCYPWPRWTRSVQRVVNKPPF